MITRRPLREEVRGEVLKRVLTGHLPPGARLKEVALADSLGVSRTPLREALRDLEHMGIVACTPGRGYAVRDLSAEDVRDTFPVLSALEDLVTDSLPVTRELVQKLDDLNRQLAAASPDTAVTLDMAWHREWVSPSPNAKLRESVLELQACAQRYETLDRNGIERAVREHDAATRALERALDGGDRAEAARLLRGHRASALQTAVDGLAPRARRDAHRSNSAESLAARPA